MTVRKLAFFECDKKRKEFYSRNLPGFELLFYAETLGQQHIPAIKDCEIISVINYSPVTEKIIEQLTGTRLIALGCTGFVNVDVRACARQGILVANTPGYSDDAVAEHTVALMLMLLRHAHTAFLQARDNNFSWQGLRGRTLRGKTLGIIGTGKIGLKVIELANAFGMRVLAYSRRQRTDEAERLGFAYADLATVLAESDILSLHLAASPETFHLFNQDKISHCKPGAVLINTSRGEICDTRALLWGLEEGILRGVALDVLEEEKLCQDSRLLTPELTGAQLETYALNQRLLRHKNVLITPHIGWFTEEAITSMLAVHLETLQAFINGTPIHLITP